MSWAVFFFFFFRIIGSKHDTGKHKNKSADTVEKRYYAKFHPFVTCIFPKNRQKRFHIFCDFAFLCLFDIQNELKIQIWPDPPNIIWGCPFFYFIFFTTTLCVSKINFKIIFDFFRSIPWTFNAIFGLENIPSHLKTCWSTVTFGEFFPYSCIFALMISNLQSCFTFGTF